jgi:uncharacterized protein YeaO (DUF488 family)
MGVRIKLSTFQIGTPPKSGQGLRIGVTRRPPRGIPKSRWERDGYFDVWLPSIAPSPKLIRRFKDNLDDPALVGLSSTVTSVNLLSNAPGRQTLSLLAKIAKRAPVSVGCFARTNQSVIAHALENSFGVTPIKYDGFESARWLEIDRIGGNRDKEI